MKHTKWNASGMPAARTGHYHDGKWVMFTPTGTAEFDDYMKLLAVKRKPDKKKN